MDRNRSEELPRWAIASIYPYGSFFSSIWFSSKSNEGGESIYIKQILLKDNTVLSIEPAETIQKDRRRCAFNFFHDDQQAPRPLWKRKENLMRCVISWLVKLKFLVKNMKKSLRAPPPQLPPSLGY
ncbi:unnamed protein product [Brassica oleracea var. botrytis]|uniref:Uncharacterized protein n=1 Tax=Brassica oleracea TaxID=3712 RepID=A0A3P6CCQ6_BRAOL|nr:unnamed protein product [Brassica oleracea]